ncbi:BPTD_3080 family restriction endonuclease [Rathayibacter soli]|uniref:BPTD_3080 family restriction endonuclease n=1 Tax=Rathayibacter soli TaxID=3144168 RepID=UPI0039082A0D
MTDPLANPILNSPYRVPKRHFVVGKQGPTGEIAEKRRPSEFFMPIPLAKKGKKGANHEQLEFDLEGTKERSERNDLVEMLRLEVADWRAQAFPRVTPISRKLLEHWSAPDRDNPILFAQREAAETAIFLSEVAGRRDFIPSRTTSANWRRRLDGANAEHNSGLPRIALKMATGSGKTIVMAMLIAWQTLNKIASPNDSRFVRRFLIVTPGITIRDRLKVLQPSDDDNYYDLRGLIPADLRGLLGKANIVIANYHQFLKRDAKEIKGVSATTRKILLAGKADPFKESEKAVVSRLLRNLGAGKGEIIVLNDEAHHCYQPRDLDEKIDAESKEANEDARVWFKGLAAIRKHVGVKAIYDLSATPFYLKGSGWGEGLIFPWTVSDFSLMDAIESGIVKVPRLPVDDNAEGDQVSYLHLWDQIKDDLPKRATSAVGEPGTWIMPAALEGALRSLYSSYERSFSRWEKELRDLGEPPPVMIVVAPNTIVSKLMYDWIAGYDKIIGDTTVHVPGKLALFSNVVDGKLLSKPKTIIVDSRQLESGEAMKKEFKDAASSEIEAFKAQYRRENPGADVDKLTDEDLLREVMNTVGKKGKLGEGVHAVVSVAMLTEGWDANTVTHILGIRAFGSQLLCEQVVGRGLRRRFYVANDEGFFEPEYANVYGIPFAFIPSDREITGTKPTQPALRVQALSERADLRIEFPILTGYRVELPDQPLEFDPDDSDRMEIGASNVPSWVQSEGIVGEAERIEELLATRPQQLAFEIADRILHTFFNTGEDRKPWLFPQLVRISRQWLDNCVDIEHGYSIGYLSLAEPQQKAAETVYNAIIRREAHEARRPRLRPMLRQFDPVGSTDSVLFDTRKQCVEVENSHVNRVTLDGKDGNSWEEKVAKVCDSLAFDGKITSFVKNDQLGFLIPYVHNGRSHSYVPDFLLRLPQQPHEDFVRTLIVEVSGSQKSPGPTKEKARTARDSWCVAVNNHRGFGRWGYIEMHRAEVDNAQSVLRDAINSLLRDEAIIGDPDLLEDFVLSTMEAH